MDPSSWSYVRAYTECPYCHSTGSSRVVPSIANAGRSLVNLLVGLVTGEPVFPMAVVWKCRHCGARFKVVRKKSEHPRCGSCDYDLTGNISGVCPECGWQIPREGSPSRRGRD